MHLTCACDYACVCIMQIQFGFELELFLSPQLITPLLNPPRNPPASYSQPWLQLSELLTVAKSCFFDYWQTQPLVSRGVGLHATGFKSLFLKNKILVVQQNRGWTRPYVRSLLGLEYTGSCLSPWPLGTRRLLGVLTGLLSKTVLERMLGHRRPYIREWDRFWVYGLYFVWSSGNWNCLWTQQRWAEYCHLGEDVGPWPLPGNNTSPLPYQVTRKMEKGSSCLPGLCLLN